MSVPAQTPYTAAVGNGVTTAFPFQFLTVQAADLIVSLGGADLANGAGYTVSGLGAEAGGMVTFSTPPDAGVEILLRRNIALLRATDYQYQGDIPAKTLNRDFDRIWLALQGFLSQLTGAIRAPFPEKPNVLPPASARANKLLSFDSGGNPTAVAAVGGSATDLAIGLAAYDGLSRIGGFPNFQALRAYAGSAARVLVTGLLVTTAPQGIAGEYVRTTNTSRPDNGGTVIVDALNRRWFMVDADQKATVETFGAAGDGDNDDSDAIQRCTTWAMQGNGVVRFLGKNYRLNTGIVVSSSTFRSIRFLGTGTGSAQTASSGGTCLLVTGNVIPITANFNSFANENIIVEGINGYNTSLNQLTGPSFCKLVRGASNSRYVSGFQFKNVGVMGFGSAFEFQGMNTVNADNNYFGNVLFDSVSVQNTGIGFHLKNCVLNLATLRNTLLLDCRYGGIYCERDGAVGAGNGKGSAFIGTLTDKTHFEGVGGMFRTDPTTVLNGLGQVTRSSITLVDFTHEACGASGGSLPAAGDPYQLGANTDINILGDVVDGISYGEGNFPYIGATTRIWSQKPVRVGITPGGRIGKGSESTVNAPTVRRTIPNGQSRMLIVTMNTPGAYALRSLLRLADGSAGLIETRHWGTTGGGPLNNDAAGTPSAGIALTWNAGGPNDPIAVTVANTTGQAITAELLVENLSSAEILTGSDA